MRSPYASFRWRPQRGQGVFCETLRRQHFQADQRHAVECPRRSVRNAEQCAHCQGQGQRRVARLRLRGIRQWRRGARRDRRSERKRSQWSGPQGQRVAAEEGRGHSMRIAKVLVNDSNLKKAAIRLFGQRLVSNESLYIRSKLAPSVTQQEMDDNVLAVRKLPWATIAIVD